MSRKRDRLLLNDDLFSVDHGFPGFAFRDDLLLERVTGQGMVTNTDPGQPQSSVQVDVMDIYLLGGRDARGGCR